MRQLKDNTGKIEKAKMKTTVQQMSFDKLKGYYGRTPWEYAE